MSTDLQKAQVLVVGAGPTGLTIALYLAKHGIAVRIIEQSKEEHGGARGTAISPRTQELLAIMGVCRDVLEIDTGPLKMAVYNPDGKTIVKAFDWSEPAAESPNIPFKNIASIAQAQLEAILIRHLEKFGCQIERGKQLIDLIQDDNKVKAKVAEITRGAAEFLIECDYLVAADGAKGRSRRFIGASFMGESKDSERLWTANVEVPGFSREYWHRWGDFATAMVALKPLYPAPLFQMQILGPALPKDLPTDLEGMQQVFDSISHRSDIKIDKADYISEWRANVRMTDKFSVGRIFLAGDAAHCHSPAGGQGTNTAMQDSFNLAWKLVLVLKGQAKTSLLDSYEFERMPVVAEMLNLSGALHSKAFQQPPRTEIQRRNTDNDEHEDPMHRSNKLLQLGVNYRWSSVVLDERKEGLWPTNKNPYGAVDDQIIAGDRAPFIGNLVAGEKTTDLFTLLRGAPSHIVLIFPFPSSSWQPRSLDPIRGLVNSGLLEVFAILENNPEDVFLDGAKQIIDVQRIARKVYVTDARTVYVTIRPDGIVGAYTFGVEGISEYFKRLGVTVL